MRMKLLRAGFILAVFVFAFSPGLYGAELVYQPSFVEVQAAPGAKANFTFALQFFNAGRDRYFLSYLGSVNGDIPLEWVSVAPGSAYLYGPGTGAATVTISVPEDAVPGTYEGFIFSKVASSTGETTYGKGIFVELTVPSLCTGAPEINIYSFGPEIIWPPNGQKTAISVSGSITVPEGCSLSSAGLSLADQYGELGGFFPIEPSAYGSFNLSVPVTAWRDGKDPNGRIYSVTVFAADEAGASSVGPLVSRVPHDLGRTKWARLNRSLY
jgi:hypothetical protein